jgi:hypothetical protein
MDDPDRLLCLLLGSKQSIRNRNRNRDGGEHVKERNYDARKDWRVPLGGVILA